MPQTPRSLAHRNWGAPTDHSILTPSGEGSFATATVVANSKFGITYGEAHLFAHLHRRVRGQRENTLCNRTARGGISAPLRDPYGVVRLGTRTPQIR